METFKSFLAEQEQPYKLLILSHDDPQDPNETGPLVRKKAKELGIELDEAELIRTNSTGLTIYNPSNLANLIKGMKNKTQTREQKIALRKQYEQSQLN